MKYALVLSRLFLVLSVLSFSGCESGSGVISDIDGDAGDGSDGDADAGHDGDADAGSDDGADAGTVPVLRSAAFDSSGKYIHLMFNTPVRRGGNYADAAWTLHVAPIGGGSYDFFPAYSSGDGSDAWILNGGVTSATTDTDTLDFTPTGPGFIEAVSGGVDLEAFSDFPVDTSQISTDTTQVYYLSLAGAGGNSGDDGAWNVVPTSAANAMSAANFNDGSNWSDSDDVEKMDAGDIVYVVGEDWPKGNDLTPLQGITLDFYEPGDFDPFDENNKNVSPAFSATIRVDVDNLSIIDGRFHGRWTGAANILTNYNMKISGLKVLRNYFEIPDQPSSISINFVCDSEISYNWFWMDPQTQFEFDECDASRDWMDGVNKNNHQGRSLRFKSGSRNRFTNNVFEGGYTALIAIHKRVFYGLDAADYGDPYYDDHINLLPGDGYHIDPDHNMIGNEIAYNTVYRFCHEGISNDNGASGSGDGDYGPVVVEWDVVTGVETNAAGKMVVTLQHENWSNAANVDRFSGYYMVSMRDNDDGFGKSSLIKSHGTDKKFVLDEPLDNLAAGDHVSIGLVYKNNWVHHNTYRAPRDGDVYSGFKASAMTCEGMALGNLYEHNVMNDSGINQFNRNRGMNLLALWSYAVRPNSDEVTHSTASQPQAFNIFRNNTCFDVQHASFDKNFQEKFPDRRDYECRSRNNAVYSNTYHEHSEAGLKIKRLGSVYLGDGVEKAFDRISQEYEVATILDSDPTIETENTVYGMCPPGIRSASISGNQLTIVLTKPCTGHDGFYLEATNGTPTLSDPGGSGINRTYALSRSITGETVTLGYTPGDVVDTGGTPMYKYFGVNVSN